MNDSKKLFSIGEMAKAAGITRRIILNYESKGLIKPDAKEGAVGNRYYTIDTFTQIRTIRAFQELGLSLDEIRDYLNDTAELRPLIKRLEEMRDEINLKIEKLYERTNAYHNQISIIQTEPQTVYIKTYHTKSIDDRSKILRETALEAMRQYQTDITRRMYFTEYPLSDIDEITYAVSVLPKSKGQNILHFPRFNALSIYHHGAYEDIPVSRNKLIAYAAEHQLNISGRCRQIYVEGPPQHKDSSKYITQIILPLVE